MSTQPKRPLAAAYDAHHGKVSSCWHQAFRLLLSPHREWRAIAAAEIGALALFARLVLPMALLPGIAWMLSLAFFGTPAHGGGDARVGFALIAYSGLLVSGANLAGVVLCATVMSGVARLYGGDPGWGRAFKVAAYSAVPVLLGGMVLVLPQLVTVLIVAFFHGLFLQYAGAQHVLHIKTRDAAEFVAVNTLALMLLSTILGAVASAAGWLTLATPAALQR